MSTEVEGTGVSPSMSIRLKSVVGASWGTSSLLWAKRLLLDVDVLIARRESTAVGVEAADNIAGLPWQAEWKLRLAVQELCDEALAA